MKHKVCDLEGELLDAAVAMAHGWVAKLVRDPDGVVRGGEEFVNYVDSNGAGQYTPEEWSPSTDWNQGGPIIERERIDISSPDPFEEDQRWYALLWLGRDAATVSAKFNQRGETPLIAAMRSFVVSRLGDEVDIL